MKIAYFTGGTAGAGHVVRGLAIGSALSRQGLPWELRLFLPQEPFPGLKRAVALHGPSICPVEPKEVLDPHRAPNTALAQALVDYAPDLLVVDMFWAPLLYIRPLLRCEAWLLVRNCPPHWLLGNDNVRFAPAQYDRVIAIEPLDVPGIREHIDPIVVSNPEDVKTREAVCARWHIHSDSRIVALCHGGLEGEIDRLGTAKEADDAFIIRADLRDSDAVFPIAPWLPSIDRVYCSAGYNSYWESHWLRFIGKTHVTPIRRSIDDPRARVEAGRRYTMGSNGADTLVRAMRG